MPIGTARLAHLCLPGPSCTWAWTSTTTSRSARRWPAADRRTSCFPGRTRSISRRRISGSDHAGGRRRDLVAGAQAAEAQRRAGGAAADPVHAARAQQLPDPPRARRSLRGDRRGPGPGAGRARGRSGAVRGAAAAVRGDDRHAAALRAHGARARARRHAVYHARTPRGRGRRPCCANGRTTSSVCTARRTPGRRARRSITPPRSCTGSRAVPAPARRSRRSSRRAGRWRRDSADTSASRPNGWRRASAGKTSARAGRRGRAPTTSSARGVASRRPHGGGRSPLPAERIDVRPAAGFFMGARTGSRRGLHGAPRRRGSGSVRDRPGRRAPRRALGDRRDDRSRRLSAARGEVGAISCARSGPRAPERHVCRVRRQPEHLAFGDAHRDDGPARRPRPSSWA